MVMNQHQLKEIVGKRITEAMKLRGLESSDLAFYCNVTTATVRGWEAGRRSPSLTALQVVGSVCDLSLDWMGFGRDGKAMLSADRKDLTVAKSRKLRKKAKSALRDLYGPMVCL